MPPSTQDSSAASQDGGEQVNITSAPITEDERQVTREREEAIRRPFPWVMVGGALVLIGLAIVAALTVGAQYAIAVAILAVLAVVFVGGYRVLGSMQSRRQGGERPGAAASDDGDDPVPHLGFDEKSQLGDSAEMSDEEQQSHADMDRSTGQQTGQRGAT